MTLKADVILRTVGADEYYRHRVQIADEKVLCAAPIEFCIAHSGLIENKVAYTYNIFGYRNQWNSTSVLGDCAAYLAGGQDSINTPIVETTYYLNSTDVQDLTAGTGVDRVRIVYLNSVGAQVAMTANLNGKTAVSLGAGFTAIQWMESFHSTTPNRIAAGDITISSINGVATEATTMEMILSGGNRSQSLRYTIPAGYKAHLLDLDSESSGTTMNCKLRATVFTDDNTISNTYHFLGVYTLASGSTHNGNMLYQPIPAGATVKLSAIPTAKILGSRLTGSLHILIIEM